MEAVCGAVEARFGVRLQPALQDTVRKAARQLLDDRLASDPEEICARLRNAPVQDPVVTRLGECASVRETYFYRDPAQLEALVGATLSHIVAKRRARGARTLRIWSAGCATGEEAYTLALLFKAAAPDFSIQVVGTDMVAAALAVAREGRYRRRSVRTALSPSIEAGLVADGADWVVRPEIRAMTTFAQLNLVTDSYPHPAQNVGAFDVVACRNVLIYLGAHDIPGVMQRIAACCAPTALVALGPAEYRASEFLPGFANLRHSIAARHTERASPPPPRPPAPAAAVKAPAHLRLVPAARERLPAPALPLAAGGAELTRAPSPGPAVVPAATAGTTEPGAPQPIDPAELLRMSRAAADRGDLAQARRWARAVLEQDPASVAARHLAGTVETAAEEHAQALRWYEQALFFDPSYAAAALGAAGACRKLNRIEEARRYLLRAQRQLASLDDGAQVPGLELPARVVARWVAAELEHLEMPR